MDVLYNVLQKRTIESTGVASALSRFTESIQSLRVKSDELAANEYEDTDEPGRRETNTAVVMKEACDVVISQVGQRFGNSDHLIAAKLVDSSLFPQFTKSFPTAEFICAVKLWPIANPEKMKTELKTFHMIE